MESLLSLETVRTLAHILEILTARVVLKNSTALAKCVAGVRTALLLRCTLTSLDVYRAQTPPVTTC